MSFLLRHGVGFFLQIFPCMLLCCLPFPPQVFRYGKKRVVAGLGLASLAASILYSLFLRWQWPQIKNNAGIYSNAFMLAVVALFVFFYFRLVRVTALKKWLTIDLVVFYAAVQFLLVNLVTPLFPDGWLEEVYPPLIVGLYAVTTALLFPVAAWMLRRPMRDFLRENDPENMKRDFFWMLRASLLFFVLIFIYTSAPAFVVAAYWWIIIPPFLFAVLILTMFYFFLLQASVQRKREEAYKRQAEIQKIQYEKITREIENARRVRHDMRHYLLGLYDMAERGRSEELRAYLAEVVELTQKRQLEWFCENATINSLLQYYVGCAREEQIDCDVLADCGELAISPVDLTVILGNALENALYACREVQGSRQLTVKIGVVGGSFAVLVMNSCDVVYPSGRHPIHGFLPADAFASCRPGGGYGLKSISQAAQKYGGEAQFRFDEAARVFTARIRLNVTPETSA